MLGPSRLTLTSPAPLPTSPGPPSGPGRPGERSPAGGRSPLGHRAAAAQGRGAGHQVRWASELGQPSGALRARMTPPQDLGDPSGPLLSSGSPGRSPGRGTRGAKRFIQKNGEPPGDTPPCHPRDENTNRSLPGGCPSERRPLPTTRHDAPDPWRSTSPFPRPYSAGIITGVPEDLQTPSEVPLPQTPLWTAPQK